MWAQYEQPGKTLRLKKGSPYIAPLSRNDLLKKYVRRKQYPYNLPPLRREYEEQSPNGHHSAKIHEAWELSMSGPTYGKLFMETSINTTSFAGESLKPLPCLRHGP